MTTPYHINIAPAAARQIKAFPSKQQKFILKVAEALAINPRPPGANKIEGMAGLHSEVVESCRIIYKIENQEILILLVK